MFATLIAFGLTATVNTGVVLTTAHLAAAGGGTSIDLTNPLVWISPVGTLIAIATGWLVPGPSYKRERDENDRKTRLFEDKIFPLAETYAATNKDSADALNRSAEALESIQGVLQKNTEVMTEAVTALKRRRT